MEILKKHLGCILLSPKIITDQRGWFEVPFSVKDLETSGLEWRKT